MVRLGERKENGRKKRTDGTAFARVEREERKLSILLNICRGRAPRVSTSRKSGARDVGDWRGAQHSVVDLETAENKVDKLGWVGASREGR